MASQVSQLQDYLSKRFVPGTNARLGNDPGFAKYLQSRPVDPNSIHDVKTLQTALRTKQINPQQFNTRFGQINNFQAPPNPYSAKSILGSAVTAAKQVLVDPTVNTAKVVPNQVALGAAEVTGNKKAITKSKQAFVNSAKGSLIGPLAQVATIGGTNLAANSVLNDKHTTPAQKQQILKKVVNPSYNKDSFDLSDTKKRVIGKGVSLGAQAELSNPLFIPASVSGAGSMLGKGLTRAGLTAAAGKDAGVNALVDAQRFNKAAQMAGTADRLGGKAVTEANTTHIPVKEAAPPTEIPVKGTSSAVVGKVTKVSDSDYIKKSTQLTKQYEKESASLKNLPSPHAQQILQDRLDTKYQGLQNELDQQAGKTNVSFTGKPTGPRSAFTKELEAQQKNAPQASTAVSDAKTTKIPVTTTKTAPASTTAPTSPIKSLSASGEPKVSGSASRTEAKAVEAGMKTEFPDKATFNGVSHKEEAANAVQLVNEDPQKAYEVAMGRRAGNNASHEAAVYHAVANKELETAKRTGDFTKVQELASSPRHAGVSEAAQKLGAEGYNVNPHDPIAIMHDVAKSRQAAIERRVGTTVAKDAQNIKKEVAAVKPKVTKQSWHEFVESIKC